MKSIYGLLVVVLLLGALYFFGNSLDKTASEKAFDAQSAVVGTAGTVSAGYDLALTKTLHVDSTAPFLPGDIVNFVITVFNQGNVPSGTVRVLDTVPTGLSFVRSDGTDAQLEGNTVLSYASIAVGEKSEVVVAYKIDEAFAGGPLTNTAEIIEDDGDDVDSTPDTDPTNDCLIDNETGRSCN